jgi:thiol reductant ABC exporter CydC subunit
VAVAVVPAWVAARTARTELALTEVRGRLSGDVVEWLPAVVELSAAGTTDRALARLAVVDEDVRRIERRVSWNNGWGTGAITAVAGLTVLGCLVAGARAVSSGELAGVWLAVVVLTPLAAFELMATLPTAAGHAHRVRAAARRVFAVVDAEPPVVDPATPQVLPTSPYDIGLDQVSVRWSRATDDAVRDLSLSLTAGRRVALVGPSGSGKSTVAAALLRFLPIHEGSYTIDEVDAGELAADDVRRVVGLLDQQAHLFDTSVRENLLLADRAAADDDLHDVLARARLADWVAGLPRGWETPVGEHGATLSGGQRQRLALARLLLADFPVVVLDEPGEHLDVLTADALTADLLAATRDRTTLIVSHRLHGLADVDEIAVMDRGRIIERGTHAELLGQGGWYASTWRRERELAQPLVDSRSTT